MVRLYRTSSIYIFRGEAKCAGCLFTSLGTFKYIEPPRSFSNHITADIKKYVEFFNMGSGWFDCPLSTYLEEKQCVQGAFALVRCSSRASNLLESS